jgi:hypothetical protein
MGRTESIRDWRAGLLALNLPLPVWIAVELSAGSLAALIAGAVQFLATLIWGLNRLNALGVFLALTAFFNGLVGHQIVRWQRVESAPWVKDIRVAEVAKHAGGSRYSFHNAHTLDRALASVTRRTRSRSGTTSSTAYYAVPIVDRDGGSDTVMAWSVGMTQSSRMLARGPEVSGTVADLGFTSGYADAIAASERKSGMRSHPSSVVLTLGDPADELAFIRRSIVIGLVVTNVLWMIACIAGRFAGDEMESGSS